MPYVSMFFGIIIRMFHREHNPPHFHVVGLDGRDAQVRLGVLTLLNGAVDRRALKEAVAWAEGNRGFLEETWNDYQAG